MKKEILMWLKYGYEMSKEVSKEDLIKEVKRLKNKRSQRFLQYKSQKLACQDLINIVKSKGTINNQIMA